jgi:hypothetical protein
MSHARNAILDVWSSVSQDEFSRIYRIIHPYTMVGNSRLRGLYRAIRYVVSNGIPGDIVECGVARGGSAALMGITLKRLGANRTLWIYDNFEGLPEPTENDPDWEIAKNYVGTCRGDLEEVTSLFDKLDILSKCRVVKGLFQDTLPSSDVARIAVLHIDCDWYDSVMACLEHLYKRVSLGGLIQIDDYGFWAGARKAVDEFIDKHGIEAKLRLLDYDGRQMIKP